MGNEQDRALKDRQSTEKSPNGLSRNRGKAVWCRGNGKTFRGRKVVNLPNVVKSSTKI